MRNCGGSRSGTLRPGSSKYNLPGKPFTGFGFRRTYLVAPHPLDPNLDRIRIDAGDNFQYHDIRNLIVTQLMRLLQRERTELVNDPLAGGKIQIVRLDEVAGESPIADLPKAEDQNQRFAKQVSLINTLVQEVRRDRVENIVLVVPPGGLSQELGDVLEEFRKVVLNDADVRVDVILSGSGNNSPPAPRSCRPERRIRADRDRPRRGRCRGAADQERGRGRVVGFDSAEGLHRLLRQRPPGSIAAPPIRASPRSEHIQGVDGSLRQRQRGRQGRKRKSKDERARHDPFALRRTPRQDGPF